MKRTILRIVAASSLVCAALAQAPATAPAKPAGPAPKAADGHPDLTGVWWRGEDVGGRQGLMNKNATPTPPFSSLYNAAAQAKAKTLTDKDDPTLRCNSTAFGTLNIGMFDVGAVAQIVQTPKVVVFLRETYHGFQLVPTDGRKHRDDIPPSTRGDAVGRWEGDTFVVDKANFTDAGWISAEGRVSFHSDKMHVIERYRRLDAETLAIDQTVEDPEVLTKPWVVPTQTLKLAPFDQIMDLVCSGTETQGLMDFAATQKK